MLEVTKKDTTVKVYSHEQPSLRMLTSAINSMGQGMTPGLTDGRQQSNVPSHK